MRRFLLIGIGHVMWVGVIKSPTHVDVCRYVSGQKQTFSDSNFESEQSAENVNDRGKRSPEV